MLHRELTTLYTWEKDYGFPQALWRIEDDLVTNRWYSRRQILAIRAIYESFGCLRGIYRSRLIPFIKAVKLIFYIIDELEG